MHIKTTIDILERLVEGCWFYYHDTNGRERHECSYCYVDMGQDHSADCPVQAARVHLDELYDAEQ